MTKMTTQMFRQVKMLLNLEKKNTKIAFSNKKIHRK
jgi:hypothetical protein